MTVNNKYELTLSSFPKVVVYQPAGNIMAYPTRSGEPAVLAFRSEEEATDFISVLSASGKVSEPCKVVNVGIRGWLTFGESLGVKHVAVVVGTRQDELKVGIVPLNQLLEAARKYTSSHSEQGQDG
jgi:hypothetical protein